MIHPNVRAAAPNARITGVLQQALSGRKCAAASKAPAVTRQVDPFQLLTQVDVALRSLTSGASDVVDIIYDCSVPFLERLRTLTINMMLTSQLNSIIEGTK